MSQSDFRIAAGAGKPFGMVVLTVALMTAGFTYLLCMQQGHDAIIAEATHDGELVIGLSTGFVRAYSEIKQQRENDLPVPAAFRAHALELATLSDFLGEIPMLEVVGFPGKSIATEPESAVLKQHVQSIEHSAAPGMSTYEDTRDGRSVYGAVWPFFATDASCVDCHNRVQGLHGDAQWKLGDLMGAQVVEKDITSQLARVSWQALLIALLVFCAVVAMLYCAMFLLKHLATTRELRVLATTDALTGCLNRHEMFHRTPDLDAGTVLMLDIDHFKAINDQYGHTAGDRVIQSMANTIKSNLRNTDWVARVGGEEFLIWLDNTTQANAVGIAERIRTLCAEATIEFEGQTLGYTVSIGVHTVKPGTQSDFNSWMKSADVRLYEAKHAGRNQINFLQAT